jgi:hypothetical protein
MDQKLRSVPVFLLGSQEIKTIPILFNGKIREGEKCSALTG